MKYATVYGCSDTTVVLGAVGKVCMHGIWSFLTPSVLWIQFSLRQFVSSYQLNSIRSAPTYTMFCACNWPLATCNTYGLEILVWSILVPTFSLLILTRWLLFDMNLILALLLTNITQAVGWCQRWWHDIVHHVKSSCDATKSDVMLFVKRRVSVQCQCQKWTDLSRFVGECWNQCCLFKYFESLHATCD